MWNGRKYTAVAIAGIGLAVAASAPASAQYSASSYGNYGYGGVYSYGWPYATYGLAGYGGSGDYGYGGLRGAYGAASGAAVSAPYNAWGTSYGIYGWAPSHGYAGYPYNGRAYGNGFRRVRGPGLGLGDSPPSGRAFAAAQQRDFARPQHRIVHRAQDSKFSRAE